MQVLRICSKRNLLPLNLKPFGAFCSPKICRLVRAKVERLSCNLLKFKLWISTFDLPISSILALKSSNASIRWVLVLLFSSTIVSKRDKVVGLSLLANSG